MGFWDWLRGRRAPDALGGTIHSFDPESGRGVVALAQGGSRTFELSQCMFTPFEGLSVVLEPDPAGGDRLRLAPDAQQTYTTLLQQQGAEAEHARSQAVQVFRSAQLQRLHRAGARRGELRAQLTADGRGVSEPTLVELERRIEADAEDREALLVYADLLQQRGEPLGQLIGLSHALEQSPGDEALEQQVRALQRQLRAAAGFPEQGVTLEWRGGLIWGLRLGHNQPDGWVDPAGDWVMESLVALTGSPAARFARRLTLGLMDDEGAVGSAELALLAEAPPLASVRELVLGDFEYPDEMELSWSTLDPPPPYAAFPNLERLTLQAGALELGRLELERLRSFELRTGGLTQDNLEAVLAARWPRLERLVLWFGDEGYGAEVALEQARGLLSVGERCELTHLGLCNAEFTDALCAELPGAEVMPQLRVLDLSRGTMSDAGARALRDQADRLGGLRELHVESNFLSSEGIALLEQLPCTVHAADQREAYDDERYVDVGE